MSRDWRLYLEDMANAIECTERFTQTVQREDFLCGHMAFEATVRQLEILGEAASHVPESIRGQAPEIPSGNIIGIRNRLIHGYFSADPDIVWNVAQEKLPALKRNLQRLLEQISSTDNA